MFRWWFWGHHILMLLKHSKRDKQTHTHTHSLVREQRAHAGLHDDAVASREESHTNWTQMTKEPTEDEEEEEKSYKKLN